MAKFQYIIKFEFTIDAQPNYYILLEMCTNKLVMLVRYVVHGKNS